MHERVKESTPLIHFVYMSSSRSIVRVGLFLLHLFFKTTCNFLIKERSVFAVIRQQMPKMMFLQKVRFYDTKSGLLEFQSIFGLQLIALSWA